MASTFKQEMPPEGGYRQLNYARTFPKKFFTTTWLLASFFVPTICFCYMNRLNRKYLFCRRTENRNGNLAIEPLLIAEREREYMRQLRRNRDEEEELMKNVPGWEVGTLFGEKVYKTIDDDVFIPPDLVEYYGHSRFKDLSEYFHLRHRV